MVKKSKEKVSEIDEKIRKAKTDAERNYWLGILAKTQAEYEIKIDRTFKTCQKGDFGCLSRNNKEDDKQNERDEDSERKKNSKDKRNSSNENSAESSQGQDRQTQRLNSRSDRSNSRNPDDLPNTQLNSAASTAGSFSASSSSAPPNSKNAADDPLLRANRIDPNEAPVHGPVMVNEESYLGGNRLSSTTSQTKIDSPTRYYSPAELRRLSLKKKEELTEEELRALAEMEMRNQQNKKGGTPQQMAKGGSPPKSVVNVNYYAHQAPNGPENLLADIQKSAALLSQGNSLAATAPHQQGSLFDGYLSKGDGYVQSAGGSRAQVKGGLTSEERSLLSSFQSARSAASSAEEKANSKLKSPQSFSIRSIANLDPNEKVPLRKIAGTSAKVASVPAVKSSISRPKWLGYLPKFISDSSILNAIFPHREPAATEVQDQEQIAGMHTDLFYNINRAYQFAGGSLNK